MQGRTEQVQEALTLAESRLGERPKEIVVSSVTESRLNEKYP